MTLSYEVGTVYYPRLSGRPRRLLVGFAAVFLYMVGGVVALLAPFPPFNTALGTIMIWLSALGLLFVSLVFAPRATWLRIGETGISYSVLFWRRHLPWSCVKELRLVQEMDDWRARNVVE